MARRCMIKLAFEVDLDMFPGFGHTRRDWVDWVKDRLNIPHYNSAVQIWEVEEVVEPHYITRQRRNNL